MNEHLRWGVFVFLTLALGGCAVPQWKPAAEHSSVAVVSVVNPTPAQRHIGITVFGNNMAPVDLGIDINKEVKSGVEAELDRSGKYTLVELSFDPASFASAKSTWDSGWSMNVLPKPLADTLVKAASGKGIDYLITVIDVRDNMQGAHDWGIYQHRGGCEDAYMELYLFVVDAHTGATISSISRVGYRHIDDLDWDTVWADIPADKKAEILSDLKSIAHDDVARMLMNVGAIPDDGQPDYQAYKPKLIPVTPCVSDM
jgi:hypothetical protein